MLVFYIVTSHTHKVRNNKTLPRHLQLLPITTRSPSLLTHNFLSHTAEPAPSRTVWPRVRVSHTSLLT